MAAAGLATAHVPRWLRQLSDSCRPDGRVLPLHRRRQPLPCLRRRCSLLSVAGAPEGKLDQGLARVHGSRLEPSKAGKNQLLLPLLAPLSVIRGAPSTERSRWWPFGVRSRGAARGDY